MRYLKNYFKNYLFYKFLRSLFYYLNSIPYKIQIIYEKKISVCIYFIFRPIIYLFEKIFEYNRIIFIINISDGIGHIVEELDYLYKFQKNNKSFFENKKVFWITKKTNLFCEFKLLYSNKFNFMKIKLSNFLFYLMLPIFFTNNKKILFDCGLGQQSYDLSDRKLDFKYDSIVRTGVRMRLTNKYLKKTIDAKNFYVTKGDSLFDNKFFTKDALKLLQSLHVNKNSKIVLLHINDRKINMSAKPTDPNTFIKLIKYLNRKNYKIIFIGRERIPKVFENYKIINYANSKHASFKNDILLFKIAKFSVLAASGLYWLPFFMKKNFLLINNWVFSIHVGHKKSLQWPALIKKGKKYYSLINQKKIFIKSLELKHSKIPDNYNIKNINNIDLLNLFKELEKRKKIKINNNKIKKYSYITKNYLNFSNIFEKKYKDLLND